MIRRLRGPLVSREPPTAVLEAGGVGYEVWMPTKDFELLPEAGAEAVVHTVQMSQNDMPVMYGFVAEAERAAFLALLKIGGIGAKSALGLLSAMDLPALAAAVARADSKSLSKAPGIGPKAASRIILEMRDSPILTAAPAEIPAYSRALESLIALGYTPAAARKALAAIAPGELDVGAMVKSALRELSSAGR